jgi:hypothetical protein
MTYVYEYQIQGDTVKVEYCFSSISDSIKVVEMWVNGKYHRVNWMSHEGREKLMTRLEDDMTNRMCGTPDDDSMIEPFMRANNMFDEDEVDVITDHIDTEIDLDRDMPGFEGTWDNLKQVGV